MEKAKAEKVKTVKTPIKKMEMTNPRVRQEMTTKITNLKRLFSKVEEMMNQRVKKLQTKRKNQKIRLTRRLKMRMKSMASKKRGE